MATRAMSPGRSLLKGSKTNSYLGLPTSAASAVILGFSLYNKPQAWVHGTLPLDPERMLWLDLSESLSKVAASMLTVDPLAVLNVDELQNRLRVFAGARDWERFHSPKNLAMAVASEAGELVDLFQWMTEEESRALSEENRQRAAEEIADVLIYLLRLGDKLGIDLQSAVLSKIELNERKYPVELARGNAVKYNRRQHDQPPPHD